MKSGDVEHEVEDTGGIDGVDDVDEPAEMVPFTEEIRIGKVDEGRVGGRKAGIARRRKGKDVRVVYVEVRVALVGADSSDLLSLRSGRTEVDDDDFRCRDIIVAHQRDAIDHPGISRVPTYAKHHRNVRGADGFARIETHVMHFLVGDGWSR